MKVCPCLEVAVSTGCTNVPQNLNDSFYVKQGTIFPFILLIRL